ncbi:hypothetical protein EXIGLDRAFT_717407 [Exidia glandulosa HHB12029]|uniref:Uncharacterized protein n=1 Tax=Exidia glandulosa HHB12029 TaxID=1314781 RepID=A0A165IEV2_EXIGL|nr:hypothetical protein EXIGLDRAFT_717407 [Exidia glandulosa HHB12029]
MSPALRSLRIWGTYKSQFRACLLTLDTMRAFTLFALVPIALATSTLFPRQQVPQAPAGITPDQASCLESCDESVIQSHQSEIESCGGSTDSLGIQACLCKSDYWSSFKGCYTKCLDSATAKIGTDALDSLCASVNGGSGGTGTGAPAPATTDDTGKGAARMLSAHESLVVGFVALSFAGVATL